MLTWKRILTLSSGATAVLPHMLANPPASRDFTTILCSPPPPAHSFPTSSPVFQIRIHFLRIRIQDFFPNPDPNPARQQKTNFSKAKTKFWEKFCFSTQKGGILFLFSTNQVGILFNRELLFCIIFKNKGKS